MKSMIPLLLAMLPMLSVAQSQSGQASGVPSVAIPNTTEVLVIETVKLYLDGKIRQWYSRGDGKGIVFLVDAKSVDEARAILEDLPLTKAQLMDSQYVPIGPLVPLRMLIGPGAQ